MPVASRAGVTGAPQGVQVAQAQAAHACATVPRLLCNTAVLLLVGIVGGCSSGSRTTSLNPVDWWHGLEGGKIAETRPPPPNADAPYPNLGTVPTKRPPPPDAAFRTRLAGGLVADRANAQYAATAQPLPVPAPSGRRPQRPVAQADSEQPNATLAAAEAQPSAATVVRRAPVTPVAAAPLSPPAPAPAAPAAAATPAAATPEGEATIPGMPDAPPPPANIAGVAVPAVTAPTPRAVAPPAPPAAPPPLSLTDAVAIPFPAQSAVLPTDALAPIKMLVRRRGSATVTVTGFGGASSTDTEAQSAALPLALARARAVAASLLASGVPSTAIRIAAEPQGDGAAARLVN
jgi:outer membrane protein OmpA-like peptidoglycan-associated protein